jgi:hypothetical protein
MREWRRWPGDTAVLRFLNRYLIDLESACSGSIKSNLRLCVRPLGGNLGRSRLGQISLILDYQIIRRKPDVKGRLFHVYGLLLQNAALDRGFVRSASLLHRDISVGDFQAHLILELLASQLTLPDLQFVANGIRLGNAIAQR